MNKYLIGFFLAWLPLYGNAIVVNSSIGMYDVTTVSGTFSEHSATLQQQVWWGNESLAYEMMSLSEGFDGLGYPNVGYNESPYFAYADFIVPPDDISVAVWTTATGCTESVSCRAFQDEIDGICFPDSGYPCVWGVAQPVPVPPALWLFGFGLLGLVGVARRKA